MSSLCNECLPGDHQTNFRLSLSSVSTCWCLSLLLPTCENTKWFAELACVLLWLQVVDESPAELESAAGNFHPTWLQGQPGDKERFSSPLAALLKLPECGFNEHIITDLRKWWTAFFSLKTAIFLCKDLERTMSFTWLNRTLNLRIVSNFSLNTVGSLTSSGISV